MPNPVKEDSKKKVLGAVNLCEILCNTVITRIYKEFSRKLSYLVSTGLIKLSLITKHRKTIKIVVDEHVDNLQEFQQMPITIKLSRSCAASPLLK